MADKPFVINDRRKFTSEGELRHDQPADTAPEAPAAAPDADATPSGGPRLVSSAPAAAEPAAGAPSHDADADGHAAEPVSAEDAIDQLPALTADQIDQVKRAYDDTIERLDVAIRSQNLGSEPTPPVTFQAVVQTLFMQGLMMLGGAAEPGQPVSVDPMGARQMIDMITAIVDKAHGNLTESEQKFTENALFELRMGFLDVTQRLARQAAARAGQGAPGGIGGIGGPGGIGGGPGGIGGPGGPSIVR